MLTAGDLTLQLAETGSNRSSGPLVIIDEVLRDVFPANTHLGGAPLNFAVTARHLGLRPLLISAVGSDELGETASGDINAPGLDCSMLGRSLA